jgi:manganese/zinc/iron transport system permease protein
MRRIERENVLRTLYKIYESQAGGVETATAGKEKVSRWVPISQILQFRSMVLPRLERCLLQLIKGEFLLREGAKVSLTPSGLARARELTRFHRLWETYLSEKVRLPSDHVHDDAEEMEHVLTGELAGLLIEELDIPARDPHGRIIPEAESEEGEEQE